MKRAKKGFTLIEMVTSLMVISVIVLALGNLVRDSHRLWGDMYETAFGQSSQDIIVTQRAFNKICRKSSLRDIFLGADKDAMRLYYFSDPSNPSYWPDRYALFYLDGTDFKVEDGTLYFGTLIKEQALHTRTLCSNVEYLQFSIQGLSVQVCLTLNDNGSEKTFAWAAVRHN